MRENIRRIFNIVGAGACLFQRPVATRQFNAGVQGTVQDPKGNVVPNVTVTLINSGLGSSSKRSAIPVASTVHEPGDWKLHRLNDRAGVSADVCLDHSDYRSASRRSAESDCGGNNGNSHCDNAGASAGHVRQPFRGDSRQHWTETPGRALL